MSRRSSIGGDVAIIIFCIILVILISILFFLCKKNRHAADSDSSSTTTTTTTTPIVSPHPFIDVGTATDNFSPANIIGTGGLGTVYKTLSSTGEALAVKRIDPGLVLTNPGPTFSCRIKSLAFARHPNLVPILGYSEAPGERVIISEFVPGENLSRYLAITSSFSTPTWRERVRIAALVARAIEHLHEAVAPGIVHGRLTSTNIIIVVAGSTGEFTAKISDFGLSFLDPKGRKGVEKYLDWECLKEGKSVCKASDVYGFGVVVLELLSGRSGNEGNLVEWALSLIKEGRIRQVLDPRLGVPLDLRPLERLAKVALACVGNARISRPSIRQVAAILNCLEITV